MVMQFRPFNCTIFNRKNITDTNSIKIVFRSTFNEIIREGEKIDHNDKHGARELAVSFGPHQPCRSKR
jgi:hypothetical protein